MTWPGKRWLVAALVTCAAGCAVQPPVERRAEPELDANLRSQAREVIMEALALLGTPYRYGGSSPATGFDCSGLVRHVYGKVTGLKLPGDARAISRHGTPVQQSEMQPGDLVFFNTLRRPYSHVGIYLGGTRFIHAPSSGGVVEIVDMNERYWRQRYEGARRLPVQPPGPASLLQIRIVLVTIRA